jgi:protein tyrosine phosphatase (PTP) superfamily phosphohydrolase (DUF442 family)
MGSSDYRTPRLVTRHALVPAATFCYVWLMVGFFTGTIVLLGPVGWLTSAVRARGWAQHSEDLLVDAIILVYVVASALLSVFLLRRINQCQTRRSRLAIPVSVTLAAALCLLGWRNPARLAAIAGGSVGHLTMSSGAEFAFGPYPSPERLGQLKKQGFTAVVSLQHPAVVPFEGPSIDEEKQAAASIGLPFIDARMLPWISDNEASLNKIRELARTGTGKYYVHCGLGRDRVNVVKHLLETEGVRTAVQPGYLPPTPLTSRLAPGRQPFERGPLRRIEKDFWVIPYPNKDEFPDILAGQVRHVTLVMNEKDPTQRAWIEEARRVFTEFSIPFEFRPFDGHQPDEAARIAEAARTAPRPSAIVVPATDPDRGEPATLAAALLKALEAQPH